MYKTSTNAGQAAVPWPRDGGNSVGQAERTLNGQRVRVRVRDGKVFVGGARVITPDVAASDGVIHVINRVLIPR